MRDLAAAFLPLGDVEKLLRLREPLLRARRFANRRDERVEVLDDRRHEATRRNVRPRPRDRGGRVRAAVVGPLDGREDIAVHRAHAL